MRWLVYVCVYQVAEMLYNEVPQPWLKVVFIVVSRAYCGAAIRNTNL